jgi:hypothetical protein
VPKPAARPKTGLLASVAETARSLVPRDPVDDALDWIRLKLDTPSYRAYQPLPAGRDGSRAIRAAACESRWEAMLPVIRRVDARSAIDVGCNTGWFLLQLGRAGIPAVGIEGWPAYFRTALYAVRKSELPNIAVQAVYLRPDTTMLLPGADCTIFLSVWHEMLRDQGKDAADSILGDVWRTTRKVLFFETGQNEMPPSYNMPPMGPDPRSWIERHLREICAGGTIEHLGLHAAGAHRRNLFAVTRQP